MTESETWYPPNNIHMGVTKDNGQIYLRYHRWDYPGTRCLLFLLQIGICAGCYIFIAYAI